MIQKQKILVICVHNSGRSQIAEAYMKQLGADRFVVESAGLEPAEAVNPLVVTVMREEGIDLSGKKPQSVFSLFKAGRLFDYVITVCDASSDARCPIFPGVTKRLHWPFTDPAGVSGDAAAQLRQVREIRDQIKQKLIQEFSL